MRRIDTGGVIDVDQWRARVRETAYQRAIRIAEATKRARDAHKPDGWRDRDRVDWGHMVQLSFMDIVDRPTERTVFMLLEIQTRPRGHITPLDREVRKIKARRPIENLRDLHASMGVVLDWSVRPPFLRDIDDDAA